MSRRATISAAPEDTGAAILLLDCTLSFWFKWWLQGGEPNRMTNEKPRRVQPKVEIAVTQERRITVQCTATAEFNGVSRSTVFAKPRDFDAVTKVSKRSNSFAT
jgi:hypothetical protein